MPLTMGLTNEEAQAIADRVLRQHWRDAGFDYTKVRSGSDHDGDPALFVTVVLKPGSAVLPADLYDGGYAKMDEAFRAEGETRFPYVELIRPDEPIVDDGADRP